MNPLDLDRLAVRIERLQRTRTHDWMPGDAMEFAQHLPDSRANAERRLPKVKDVRSCAARLRKGDVPTVALQNIASEYRRSLQWCLRLESLISRNRSTSIPRIMHDMRRGRMPGLRR